jgi:YD repeat-containing protein
MEYDQDLNKPIAIMDALGNVTEIGYDSKGNLASIEDPPGNTTSISLQQIRPASDKLKGSALEG